MTQELNSHITFPESWGKYSSWSMRNFVNPMKSHVPRTNKKKIFLVKRGGFVQ